MIHWSFVFSRERIFPSVREVSEYRLHSMQKAEVAATKQYKYINEIFSETEKNLFKIRVAVKKINGNFKTINNTHTISNTLNYNISINCIQTLSENNRQ